MIWLLVLVICYLVGKLAHERWQRDLGRRAWENNLPLRDAGLNSRQFMFCSVSSEEDQEQPEAERLHTYIHCPSGNFLYLKPGGRFFEYQDGIYDGPTFYPALGGIVHPGTPCKQLVEIDRAKALASLKKDRLVE